MAVGSFTKIDSQVISAASLSAGQSVTQDVTLEKSPGIIACGIVKNSAGIGVADAAVVIYSYSTGNTASRTNSNTVLSNSVGVYILGKSAPGTKNKFYAEASGYTL